MTTPPHTPAVEAHTHMAQTPESQPPQQPPQPAPGPSQPAPDPATTATHAGATPAPDPATTATHAGATPTLQPPSQPAHQLEPAPRIRAAAGGNSWQTPVVVALIGVIGILLGAGIVSINGRINSLENRIELLENRIQSLENRIENRIDSLENRIDARFAALEQGQHEINLKLTALIAYLNLTDEVDAAISGRITSAETSDTAGASRDESHDHLAR